MSKIVWDLHTLTKKKKKDSPPILSNYIFRTLFIFMLLTTFKTHSGLAAVWLHVTKLLAIKTLDRSGYKKTKYPKSLYPLTLKTQIILFCFWHSFWVSYPKWRTQNWIFNIYCKKPDIIIAIQISYLQTFRLARSHTA
jgi:hypothetical protein